MSGSWRGEDLAVGLAHGDADRVPAAHQDALHERLAAVREASHGAVQSQRRRRGRRGGPTGPSAAAGTTQSRAERSRRFWKRSTWPAVSTIVCLPV